MTQISNLSSQRLEDKRRLLIMQVFDGLPVEWRMLANAYGLGAVLPLYNEDVEYAQAKRLLLQKYKPI